MASTSSIKTYASRARQHTSPEDKLDELAKAISEMAGVLDDLDRRLKRTEALAAAAANRR